MGDKHDKFLDEIALGKPVRTACELADISHDTVYRLRRRKTEKGRRFKSAWIAARRKALDREDGG